MGHFCTFKFSKHLHISTAKLWLYFITIRHTYFELQSFELLQTILSFSHNFWHKSQTLMKHSAWESSFQENYSILVWTFFIRLPKWLTRSSRELRINHFHFEYNKHIILFSVNKPVSKRQKRNQNALIVSPLNSLNKSW